jgi:hypothetical protein
LCTELSVKIWEKWIIQGFFSMLGEGAHAL